MDERKMYQMIDFILNQAESSELEVIRAALRRREGGDPSDDGTGGDIGKNIGKMATDMASKVKSQVGVSEEQIRGTVKGFVRDMIEREAPELRGAQVEELLEQWVPGMGGKTANPGGAAQKPQKGEGLPPDVMLTMIRHFVSFSTGSMTVAEETSLDKAMPEWQRRYWERFSPVGRKLVTLYVKGVMSEPDFWAGVYDELGLDANGSPSSP